MLTTANLPHGREGSALCAEGLPTGQVAGADSRGAPHLACPSMPPHSPRHSPGTASPALTTNLPAGNLDVGSLMSSTNLTSALRIIFKHRTPRVSSLHVCTHFHLPHDTASTVEDSVLYLSLTLPFSHFHSAWPFAHSSHDELTLTEW